MLVSATTVPTKCVFVSSAAELPICQNTWQACAPLIRLTPLDGAVVRDEPAWNTKTASGLPPPSRMSVPVRPIVEPLLYTPGAKV